jgi:hypothetical protein
MTCAGAIGITWAMFAIMMVIPGLVALLEEGWRMAAAIVGFFALTTGVPLTIVYAAGAGC